MLFELDQKSISDLKKSDFKKVEPGVMKSFSDFLSGVIFINFGITLLLGFFLPSAFPVFLASFLTLFIIYIFDRLQAKEDKKRINEAINNLHKVIWTYEKEFEKRKIKPPEKISDDLRR